MDASRILYQRALRDFQCARGEPLALARGAASAAAPLSPEFADARLLEATLLLCSRNVRDFESAGWVLAGLAGQRLTPLQQRHANAVRLAVDGDYARATQAYDELLKDYPTDELALGAAQVFDYYIGDAARMRVRAAHALMARPIDSPGYHAVLSLNAYALQECGDYEQAEVLARQALELEPYDLRAHHAASHVFEMQGRFAEGVRWMGSRTPYWTGAGVASVHLWWHLALYHVELGRHELALSILDRRMQGESLAELIDASALLWRLHLMGVPVGTRFAPLAARWSPHAEDAHCAFNDLHAMMAFVGAGRWDSAERLLGALLRRADGPWNTNQVMTRLVGLPACQALVAYGREDYAQADALLRSLPPVAHRIGGSHAQRDVLQLTRAAAATRRSMRRAA